MSDVRPSLFMKLIEALFFSSSRMVSVMASSLNKPTSDPGLAGGSVFGLAWRSEKSPGPETVITSARSMPLIGASNEGSASGIGVAPRLFPSTQDAENVAGIAIGHFTIQRRIGIGGMGSVFLASDERLKRDVALKVLSPSLSLDQTSVQRFRNEAQAAARLDHDNIARVFYSGEESGLHYIAYEYVPGQNLRDVIRGKGWLDPAEAVNYAIQLTAALHHSSSAGVIHRDIKPSNVLITPFGRAKLVDLGLARKTSIDSSFELTVPGTTLGTFDYISPEQARDPHSVDVRSDIYSLGCTLYHMLTGEPPYPEGTVLQKLLDHHDKDPPDPTKKNRRVSPMLSRVVRKMMASQPNHRYANPGDLLRDLLMVARSLGAGAVPIDGQVWLTATRFKPPFWQSNFGWVATTCALCLMVTAVQLYPSLTQKAIKNQPLEIESRNRRDDSIEGESSPAQKVASVPSTKEFEATAKPSNDPLKSVRDDFPYLKPAAEPNATVTPSTEAVTLIPRDRALTPVPEPAPTEDKATVAPKETVEAIQTLNGKSYASLEAACAEATDALTIIELRYNGLREPERPIRLGNKKVIIRAGEGYRPTIRFAVTDASSDASQYHMITVAGGSLELVKVDLVMTVPNRGSDRWALFSLERPENVQLKRVVLTVVNPYSKTACVFEQRVPVGQSLPGTGIRKDGMPVVPPKLTLTESFVRGVGDFIVMRDPVPARLELKDTVIGVDGNLLQIKKLLMDSTGMDRESITLDLEHVTCLLGQSLLTVEGAGGMMEKLPPIFLFARNNVISCGPGRPLISMRGLADFMDFQQSFSWEGNLNFYDNIETFLEISTPELSSNRKWDHAYWKSFWGTNEGGASSNAPLLWRTKSFDRSFANLTEESVELSAMSAPVKGASDGFAAGATLKKLPSVKK